MLEKPLLRLGKANGRVAKIIDRVPLPKESVAKNSKRSHGLREVHAHECRNTGSLDLQDVVISADGEVVAGEGESKVRKAITLVTLDSVLTVESLFRTNLLVPMQC